MTTPSRKFLNGLTKCLENNLPTSLDSSKIASWKLAKEIGERFYKVEHGGSPNVFNQRPIPEDIISYCVGDVLYLPNLRSGYWKHRNDQWKALVCEESKKRVAMSQRSDYQPQNPAKVMAPWNSEQNMLLDQWNYVPRNSSFDSNDDLDDGWDDDWDDRGDSWRDFAEDWDLYYSD